MLHDVVVGIATPTMERYTLGPHSCIMVFVIVWPGLAVLWDDAADLHAEQLAPYQHVRDVLLLRATQENTALLLASHSRSTEAQRLVASGWAASIAAERSTVRSLAPRVVGILTPL